MYQMVLSEAGTCAVGSHDPRRRSPLFTNTSQFCLESADLGVEHDIFVVHVVELLLAIFIHLFKVQTPFLPT